MLNKIVDSTFVRPFLGFLAVVFFNISIDVVNSNTNCSGNQMSYNVQESIVELVVEKVLGFEDAIAEVEEHESDERSKSSAFKLSLFSQHLANIKVENKPIVDKQKQRYFFDKAFLTAGFLTLDTPPPKV